MRVGRDASTKNAAAAALFETMADVMEIKGGDAAGRERKPGLASVFREAETPCLSLSFAAIAEPEPEPEPEPGVGVDGDVGLPASLPENRDRHQFPRRVHRGS